RTWLTSSNSSTSSTSSCCSTPHSASARSQAPPPEPIRNGRRFGAARFFSRYRGANGDDGRSRRARAGDATDDEGAVGRRQACVLRARQDVLLPPPSAA